MAELELLEYYKKMCERNILLDFQGAVSHDLVVGMAELIKKKFSQEYGKSNIVKKVFSIFVEMAQNISFYSAERVYLDDQDSNVGAGIIVVTGEDKMYTVTSGNLVEKAGTPKIIRHCQTINRMGKEELRRFYKEKIKSSRKEGRRGAGVGLIDIARKSGRPISYGVTPVDGTHSFLVLSVKIQEENNQEENNNG
jgi:hypothetical protein